MRGDSEHRNTAEKFDKYRNIAKKNRQIPQYYNTVSKVDVILKPLHCTLSLEQLITRKQKLIEDLEMFDLDKINTSSSVLANN